MVLVEENHLLPEFIYVKAKVISLVNSKDSDVFFSRKTGSMLAQQPLKVVDLLDKFDIRITVDGGGISGQAGAVRHGISRALHKL